MAGVTLAVLVLASTPSAALNGTSNVILSVLPGPYSIGDTVTATIRVYNNLAPADPSNLTFYIYTGLSPYYPYGRILNTTRLSAGVYTGTFTLRPSDVRWGYPYPYNETLLTLEVSALVGTTWDWGIASVFLYSPGPGIQTVVTPSARTVAPGQSVTFDAAVYLNGTPADPDTITGNLWLATDVPNLYAVAPMSLLDHVAASFDHVATGDYRATYTVPSSLSERAVVSLSTVVVYAGNYASGVGRALVDPGASLAVWYHLTAWGPLNAEAQVCVADATAASVSGAAISASYFVYVPTSAHNSQRVTRSASSATNATGCAVLYLPFPVGYNTPLAFWGNATAAGRTQAFAGAVGPARMELFPQPVTSTGAFRTYAPGDTVNRTYALGTSNANLPVAYYASAADGWVTIGSATANATGNVTLAFTAPSRTVQLTLVDAVNNAPLAADTVFVADPARMTVQGLALGTVAHITVSGTGPDGSVALLPYDNGSRDPLEGFLNWNSFSWGWALGSGLSGSVDLVTSAGPGFSCDLVVPRFLPGNRTYMLFVDVGDPAGSVTHPLSPSYYATRIVYLASLPPTPSANPVPVGPTSTPLVLLLAGSAGGLAGLIAGIAVVMVWRRTKPNVPPSEGRPPEAKPPPGGSG